MFKFPLSISFFRSIGSVLVVLCTTSLTILAQMKYYNHSTITINEGLAHNTVENIYKDKDGFLWFGTLYGLNSYDGYEIKTYRKNLSDSNSISNNKITSIAEDQHGFLWIGTTNGLNRLDKRTNRFQRYFTNDDYESLPGNQIIKVKNIKNEIWIGTNEGLASYNFEKNSFERYIPRRSDTSFNSLTIYDICETRSGDIYIASENQGIHKLDINTKKFTPIYYTRASHLLSNYRKYLLEDNEGSIWISAFSHGLVKYSPETGKSIIYTQENSNIGTNFLNGEIVLTPDNKLWISSDGNGIIVYSFENDDFYNLERDFEGSNLTLDKKIYSILLDEQGIAWLGSFNNGITVLNPNHQKFNNFTTKYIDISKFNGLSVLSIFEDSQGCVWIGTDGSGIFQYLTDGTLNHYYPSKQDNNTLSSDRIVCINEDEHGNILIGSYTGGLMSLNANNNKVQRYLPNSENNSIASPHVWSILKQNENKIWLGLLGNGLDLFDPINETFTHYGPNTNNLNKVNNGNINCIIEDRDGDLWFGTSGNGINILDKETGKMFYSLPSSNFEILNENEIRCLYQDSQGIIWIATEDGGLYNYNKELSRLKYTSLSEGLDNNMVASIIEDNNQNLWLGTGNGVLKYNVQSETYQYFNSKNGLAGNMCNRNSIYKLSNGVILIGSSTGLSIFHPDSIRNNLFTPNSILTQLRIQNKIVKINDTVNNRIVLDKNLSYTNEISLLPKDKTFTIEFASINYTLPNNSSFKYMLEGFETSWKTTSSNRRFATYTNLDPGKYTFKVIASNSDGIWSQDEASIKINILPTFWRTIWFKAIILIILSGIVYLVYRYLLSEREKQFKREKLADEQKIVHLEKEKLEAELNNQTFNVIGRNKTLIALRRRLSIVANRVDKKNEDSLLDIIGQINKEINEEKDWKHIEPRLDKVYNNFMTSLKNKHADLTQSELRTAAYVRMGLSTKEISELMQKTSKAVENDRYRLRRKLEIQLNSSLKKYLLDL